jgi:hypothetical protein
MNLAWTFSVQRWMLQQLFDKKRCSDQTISSEPSQRDRSNDCEPRTRYNKRLFDWPTGGELALDGASVLALTFAAVFLLALQSESRSS